MVKDFHRSLYCRLFEFPLHIIGKLVFTLIGFVYGVSTAKEEVYIIQTSIHDTGSMWDTTVPETICNLFMILVTGGVWRMVSRRIVLWSYIFLVSCISFGFCFYI